MAGPGEVPETRQDHAEVGSEQLGETLQMLQNKRIDTANLTAKFLEARSKQVDAWENGVKGKGWKGIDKAKNKTVKAINKRVEKISNTIAARLDPARHSVLDHHLSKIENMYGIAFDNIHKLYMAEIQTTDDIDEVKRITQKYIKDVQQITEAAPKHIDNLADLLAGENAEVIAEISKQTLSMARLLENRDPLLEQLGLRKAVLRRTAHVTHPDQKGPVDKAKNDPAEVAKDLQTLAESYTYFHNETADIVLTALRTLPENQKKQFLERYMDESERRIKKRPETPASTSQQEIDEAVARETLKLLNKGASRHYATFTPQEVRTYAKEYLGVEITGEQFTKLQDEARAHDKGIRRLARRMSQVNMRNPLHSYLSLTNIATTGIQLWGITTAAANIYVNMAHAYRTGEAGFVGNTIQGLKGSLINPWTATGIGAAVAMDQLRDNSSPSKKQKLSKRMKDVKDFQIKHPELVTAQSAASLGMYYNQVGQYVGDQRLVENAISFLEKRQNDSSVGAAEKQNLPGLISILKLQKDNIKPYEFRDYLDALGKEQIYGIDGADKFKRNVAPKIDKLIT